LIFEMFDELANLQLEPTRPICPAITTLSRAAQVKRWADKPKLQKTN